MSKTASIQNSGDISQDSANESNWPFNLLILLLLFDSFRPDRLLPGGDVIKYLPTALIFILGILWIQTQPKTLKNAQTKFFIAFCFTMIIHIPFVRNLGYLYIITEGFFLYTVTSYLLRVQFLNSYSKLNKYITLFAGLAIFKALLGIFGGGKLSVPILRDENDFCLFVNTMLPFAFFLAAYARSNKEKFYFVSLFIILIAANIASFSRGGFVGLIPVLLFLIYKSKHKIKVLITICALIVIALSVAPKSYIQEIKTLDSNAMNEGTGKERMELWAAGWEMFLDHPLIGVGPLNYNTYISDYHHLGGRMWGKVAHSLYFTLLPEMGILGTLFFLGMLVANVKSHTYIAKIYRTFEFQDKSLPRHSQINNEDLNKLSRMYAISLSLCGAMIAYLVTGIFIAVLWYKYFWLFNALWVANYNVTYNIVQKNKICMSK